MKKNNIYFVATTKFNVSPSFTLELLERVAKVFKDYCGILSEESIRKNFVLLYELLDEMIDYGYPQSTSTEHLKMYVHNEPVPVEALRGASSGMLANKKTISSTAVQKPISLGVTGAKKNEIFVDILERLTVLFNANGYVLNSTIDGCIQMKSYLSGNPGLRLALNEDMIVGRENSQGGYGGLVLDDCNFHETVNLDDFEGGRTLALIPPDGEFVAMNYRITSEFRAPFRVFPVLEESSQYKLELLLRVRADIPDKNHGANVVIRFPVPKTASSVTPEVGAEGAVLAPGAARGAAAAVGGGPGTALGQTAEFDAKAREVVWTIKKFQGGSEQTLRTRITLSAPSGPHIRKELGPISMSFEIPMYNVSNLQVRVCTCPRACAHTRGLTLSPPHPPFALSGAVPAHRGDAQELQAEPMGALPHVFQLVRLPPLTRGGRWTAVCVRKLRAIVEAGVRGIVPREQRPTGEGLEPGSHTRPRGPQRGGVRDHAATAMAAVFTRAATQQPQARLNALISPPAQFDSQKWRRAQIRLEKATFG